MAGEATQTAYDFSFVSINGTPLPLSDFDGKIVLIVNTASFCGFTRQYADLQSLYERFSEQGLVVLGVPSNDFGGQIKFWTKSIFLPPMGAILLYVYKGKMA